MKDYKIQEKDLVNLVRYLETRPFKEVNEGIKMLTSLEEIKSNVVPIEKKKDATT